MSSEFAVFLAVWFACICLVMNFVLGRLLRQSLKQNRELLTMVNDLVARLNQANAITTALLDEKRNVSLDQEEQSGDTLH